MEAKKNWIQGHHNRSEEAKKALSLARKGKNNPMFGKHHSEEAKTAISVATSGENNPMFGKRHTDEVKEKLSISHLGKVQSEESKKKISSTLRGREFSEETRNKISIANTGRVVSEETRRKISIGNKGKTILQETKEKQAINMMGENNHFFGKHHTINSINKISVTKSKPDSLYAPGNSATVKEKIRVRDNHTCQECGKIWSGKGRKFVPHHIDYHKKNHIFWNRITLCQSCHSKSNFDRSYWTAHFYEIITNNCTKRILSS